jgi:hypothetical protein
MASHWRMTVNAAKFNKHEEHVHCNRSSIFNLVSRFHELKNQISTQVAEIMGSLLDLKKQIAVVEAECSLLRNLALNLWKGNQSMVSSQKMTVCSSKDEIKGEETMNQFDEEMATTEQKIEPTSTGLEDAASRYALC